MSKSVISLMQTRNTEASANHEEKSEPDGLLLVGKLVARRRRTVPAKKPGQSDKFVIMLQVEGAGTFNTAETWSDIMNPLGLPELGDYVKLPVQVRTYVQGGLAKYTLVFGEELKGEAF